MPTFKRIITTRRQPRADPAAPGGPSPSNQNDRAHAQRRKPFFRDRAPTSTPAPTPTAPSTDLQVSDPTPSTITSSTVTAVPTTALSALRLDDTHSPASSSASIHHSPSTRVSSPLVAGSLFRLGLLPVTHSLSLEHELQPAGRSVTFKRGDVARVALATALANRRDLNIVASVTEEYLPYALTAWQMSDELSKRGHNLSQSVTWMSALMDNDGNTASTVGGMALEAAMVTMLSALNAFRRVLETPGLLGMAQEVELISQVKELQRAAGKFSFLRDNLAPFALAIHDGNPVPEICPSVAGALYSLTLAIAQSLHVRRAHMNNMSASTLLKISAAARELVLEVRPQLDEAVRNKASVSRSVTTATMEIEALVSGWTFQFLAEVEEDAGKKCAALRGAVEQLEQGAKGEIVAKVAEIELEALREKLEDAMNENRIVYQDAVPEVDELVIPPGRSLVSATVFEPPFIAKSETS